LELSKKEASMSEKVFKKISVTGCSSTSYEKAIENAVEKASVSLRNLAWFEVREFRGGLGADGEIEWQATIEVAFKID
jgi:flavin-binding protein dodecin